MSTKKVIFGRRPAKKEKESEDWIYKSKVPKEKVAQGKMKRLTLDIPEKLHKKIKMQAVQESKTMAEQLRKVLEDYYGR